MVRLIAIDMLICIFLSDGQEIGSVLVTQHQIQNISALDKETMKKLDWKRVRLEGVPKQTTISTETTSSLINEIIRPGEEEYDQALIRWIERASFPVVVLADERVSIWKKMERTIETNNKAFGYAMTLLHWPDADLPFWQQTLSSRV